MNINLGKLGGQIGALLCLLGFLAIFLGWNGAAGKNVSQAQFPYLISGGVTGLAIVIVGAAALIVQSAREDRVRLEATLERIATALEAGGGPRAGAGIVAGVPSGAAAAAAGGGMVLAGSMSYHRLDCVLTEARDEARVVGLEEALGSSLAPCRVCKPPAITAYA